MTRRQWGDFTLLRVPVLRGFLAALVLAAASIAAVVVAAPASAHPLGNFTVNTSTTVTIGADATALNVIVDMAEIPTLQTRQRIDGDNDGSISTAERDGYLDSACLDVRRQLSVHVGREDVVLASARNSVAFPPGQAGLTTLRLECGFTASAAIGRATTVSVANHAFEDRAGWREFVARGDGVTLRTSDAPTESSSRYLTAYPTNLATSPPRQDSVRLEVEPGGVRLTGASGATRSGSPLPRGVDGATRAFSSFVGRRQLSVSIGAAALVLALVLGAVHALAPGHGKTVMAAYLVGQRGSPRQAAVIGLTVTATHTLGVLALGIAIAASQIVTPERLYPYLGAISGFLLAAIGANILRGALRMRPRRPDVHDHGHDSGDGLEQHGHHHDLPTSPLRPAVQAGSVAVLEAPARIDEVESPLEEGWHQHGGRSHRHAPLVEGQPLTWSNLLALGFVGGFLPSPSAVVVLLGAIALHRAWFGVLLVIAYGAGMAATLMGAGLLLVRARGTLERRLVRVLDRGGHNVLTRWLPYATAGVIIAVGTVLAVQGLISIPR